MNIKSILYNYYHICMEQKKWCHATTVILRKKNKAVTSTNLKIHNKTIVIKIRNNTILKCSNFYENSIKIDMVDQENRKAQKPAASSTPLTRMF